MAPISSRYDYDPRHYRFERSAGALLSPRPSRWRVWLRGALLAAGLLLVAVLTVGSLECFAHPAVIAAATGAA